MVRRPRVGLLPLGVRAAVRAGLQVSLKRDLMCFLCKSFGWYSQCRKSFGAVRVETLGRSGAVSIWVAAARNIGSMSEDLCPLASRCCLKSVAILV